MHPAALRSGRWIHLRQSRPEPQCPVAHGELRRAREAALLHPQQHLAPALGGLAHPVLDGQEVFLAAGVHANDHQHAQPLALAAKGAVDAVRPQVHPLVVEPPPAPLAVLLVPAALEPTDDVRRQPTGGLLAHQRADRLTHLPGGHPVQVQPRNRRIEACAAPNVGRHHRRAERLGRTRAAACLGHPHVHLAHTGENLAFRKVAVANHPLAPVGQLLLDEPRQVLLELRRDRRLDQPTRAGPQKLRQRVTKPVLAPPAKPQYRCSCAVCSSCRNREFHNSISAETRRTTQLIRTPLSTIAPTRSTEVLRTMSLPPSSAPIATGWSDSLPGGIRTR